MPAAALAQWQARLIPPRKRAGKPSAGAVARARQLAPLLVSLCLVAMAVTALCVDWSAAAASCDDATAAAAAAASTAASMPRLWGREAPPPAVAPVQSGVGRLVCVVSALLR